MNANWAKFIQVLAVLMFVSGLLMYNDLHWRKKPPQTVVKTQTDTLYIRDTITAYKPVPFNVYVVDTLFVPVPVAGGRDTVWAELPREAKEYRDSTYRAVVSGYRPSLDTIDVYQRTAVVTVTERVQIPAPRLSWGIQAGVGAWNAGITPYVGIGIQYRLGSLDFRRK